MAQTIRVGAIQAKQRTISYKTSTVDEVLKQVRLNLDALTALAERAAEMGCHIIAFPEARNGEERDESQHFKPQYALHHG